MLFDASEQIDKHQLAVTDLTRERTLLELEENVKAFAKFLSHECSLEPGDHIALHIGNRVEFIELMLAGIVAGVWVTPINTHLTNSEASYILDNCDAKVLFHDTQNSGLKTQLDKAYNVETLVVDKDIDSTLNLKVPAGGTMLYTSGTTGKPKGVKRHQPSMLKETFERMRQGAMSFGLKGEGAHLVTGPLYHAAPMLFAIYDLLNGAPMVIMPKWDCRVFLDCVSRYKVASTHLVPTMFVRLLNEFGPRNNEYDLSSLKLVLHGAAPIDKTTKTKMLDWWGDILLEYWGGSEAGTTTLVTSEEWRTHPGTVGKPLSHFEVFVGDKQGNPIAANEGLLFCRHKHLEQVFEYYKDPDKTLKAHPKPHTFCIGDIGYVSEEGYVYLSDRESNMIISGGVNIYPAEVEQVLMSHEKVLDCVVFGKPNPEWGEEVKALVQLSSPVAVDSDLMAADLVAYLRDKIAKYKLPRTIEIVESLPRSATGKIKSKDLDPYR